MGIRGLFRGVGTGHAERDGAGLGQFAETVQFLELALVGAHERGGETDGPFAGSLETAHRGEGTTIAHRRNGELFEDRAVGETIDTIGKVLADALGNIITPANDPVGTQRCNQLFVRFGGIGNNRQPIGLGQLDDIPTIGAGGAVGLNPPVEGAPGRKVCYMQDPDGNWIELIESS